MHNLIALPRLSVSSGVLWVGISWHLLHETLLASNLTHVSPWQRWRVEAFTQVLFDRDASFAMQVWGQKRS
jgi:hypothetical protein